MSMSPVPKVWLRLPAQNLGLRFAPRKAGQCCISMAFTVPDLQPLSLPSGSSPNKPCSPEPSTVCSVTFVYSRGRGSCICADLVPVSCLSLSCLSLPVSSLPEGRACSTHRRATDVARDCAVPPPPSAAPRAGMDMGWEEWMWLTQPPALPWNALSTEQNTSHPALVYDVTG